MNIIVISFSGRSDGNCDRICDYIAQSYASQCTVFRFSEQQIHPCGGCRYECFGTEPCPYREDPEYELLESICQSDLTYFVIPNYRDYPCANYFIFNERSQCFFQGKPERLDTFLRVRKKFIVVSNTNQENFRQILSQNVDGEPEILFLSAKKFGRKSVCGDLMASAAAVAEIDQFVSRKTAATSGYPDSML